MSAPNSNLSSTPDLTVPRVLALIERWTDLAAQWDADVKYHQRPAFKDDPSAAVSAASCQARASIYAACIQDLKAELARATAPRST